MANLENIRKFVCPKYKVKKHIRSSYQYTGYVKLFGMLWVPCKSIWTGNLDDAEKELKDWVSPPKAEVREFTIHG